MHIATYISQRSIVFSLVSYKIIVKSSHVLKSVILWLTHWCFSRPVTVLQTHTVLRPFLAKGIAVIAIVGSYCSIVSALK